MVWSRSHRRTLLIKIIQNKTGQGLVSGGFQEENFSGQQVLDREKRGEEAEAMGNRARDLPEV